MKKVVLVVLAVLLPVLAGCNLSMRQADTTPPPPTPKPAPPSPYAEEGFHWVVMSQPRPQNAEERPIPNFNDSWEIPSDWDTYKLEASQSPTGYGAINLRLEIDLFGETLIGEGNCTTAEITFADVTTDTESAFSVETVFPALGEGENQGYHMMLFYLYCDAEQEKWYFARLK